MAEPTIPAKILVVDDEPGMRTVLLSHLTQEGYEVVTAANGDAAVKVLTQDHFDLVITDLVMPGGDGYVAMEYVEQHCPDTAIIVITAYGSLNSAIEAMRRGAADYVEKPFELALLSLAVNRVLERQRLAREATRRADQLHVLAEITQAINSSLDIEEVYRTLVREAGRVLDFDRMTLSLLTSDGQQLAQRSLADDSSYAEGGLSLIPLEDTGEGWVIQQRRAFLTSDAAFDDRLVNWAVRPPPEIHSLIVVPLIVKDKDVGTLSFGHRRPHVYADEELLIVEQMAGQLATAVENARLLKQTQEQLDALRRTQDQLIRSERVAAVGDLARGLAHELNNPLAVVVGTIQYLQQQPDISPTLSSDLERIAENASRMADLIRSFTELALPGSREPYLLDVNSAVEEVLELMHSRFARHSVTEERVFASPSPLIVGHPHQLKRILLNLLLNADEATARMDPPARGHEIRIETSVSRDSEGRDWVHVAVSDTGGGIESADLVRIFDPGYTTKVENGTMRGLGMGLYVAYGLVQAYGGTIDVESRLGWGSRFTICLPAEPVKKGTLGPDE